MSTEIIKVNPEEFGLKQNEVATIEQAFLPKIQEREAIAAVYEQLITKELTPELCKEAKTVRLQLVKVRTGISDIHKTQKAFFLAAGRFVDAWKNKETLPVEQMEEKLSEIENYYINIEKERIAKLNETRKAEAMQFTDYPAPDLGNMSDDVYTAYLNGLKVAHEARIEAERKAEEERLAKIEAERLEQIRIREENARLQAEAEQREKEMAAERAKAEAERKAIEEKARKERESAEAILKAEQEKARIEAEKAAKEKAALEAELRAKAEKEAAELRAKQEAEKQAQIEAEKAAKAPRKEKLTKWVDSFQIAEFDNDATAAEITEKFNAFKKWATEQINKI